VQEERDRVGSLAKALKAVREDAAALRTSDDVEARLRAEVRTIGRMRARRVAVLSLAAAAVLAVVGAVTVRRAAVERGAAPAAASGPAGAEVATAFFPLDYSGMPVSNAQLVRLEVPRAALASFGLTSIDVHDGGSGAAGGGTVQADVLVGEDGVARAVRFIGRIGGNGHRLFQERER